MDLEAEVVSAFSEMEWEDVVSTLEAAIHDVMDETSHHTPPLSSPAPTPLPAWMEPNNDIQFPPPPPRSPSPPRPILPAWLEYDLDLPLSPPPSPVPVGLEFNTDPPSHLPSPPLPSPPPSPVLVGLEFNADLPSPLPPPPSPSPPPSPLPAGPEVSNDPQPGGSQCGRNGDWRAASPMMAAPTVYNEPLLEENILQPGHLYSQADIYGQGEYNNVPEVRLLEGIQNLRPVGVLNGELLYELPGGYYSPPVSAAPPLNTFNSKKRKRESQQDDGRPYIKKPPNAFMMFMKEQRPLVVEELSSRGSAAVNTFLGQAWKSLTAEQQAKYYEQAETERRLHAQRHPDWSSGDNYGKKRKRQRRTIPKEAQAGVTRPRQRILCFPPYTDTGFLHLRELTSVEVELPDTEMRGILPVCQQCHNPQLIQVLPPSCLDAPETASTSFANAAAPTHAQTESSQSEDIVAHQPMTEQLESLPVSPQPQRRSYPDLSTVDFNI